MVNYDRRDQLNGLKEGNLQCLVWLLFLGFPVFRHDEHGGLVKTLLDQVEKN